MSKGKMATSMADVHEVFDGACDALALDTVDVGCGEGSRQVRILRIRLERLVGSKYLMLAPAEG
jgi:hypothetical protein